MSKAFILAIVRANGTRWNVTTSNERQHEVFVALGGALGYCKTMAKQVPVEALVYRPGGDCIEEAWFYEGDTERKLNIITLPEPDSKRGNW